MKLTRLGIVIPFFLLLVWGVGAQTYAPELNCEGDSGGSLISNLASGKTAYASFNDVPNKLTLRSSYPSGSYPPGQVTAADYKPLEFFWEFEYSNSSYREYSFDEAPVCVFPKSNTGISTAKVIKRTIDDYDEGEPPPRTYGYEIQYGSAGDIDPASRNLYGSKVTVMPSWSPSPNDEIVFIVRFEVECDLDIVPGSSIGTLDFNYSGSMVASVDETFPIASTINNNTDLIQWTVSDNDLRQGVSTGGSFLLTKYCDYYVRFKLANGISEGDDFSIKAKFSVDPNLGICPVDSFPETKLRVRNSHDPNAKSVLGKDIICMEQSGDVTVRYRIDYQNIGNGGAENVTIEDWLDEKAFVKSIKMINSKHPVTDMTFDMSTKVHPDPSSGYMYWHFNYPLKDLRGTDEDDYNITFLEDSTQSWLIFEVVYSREVLKSCNALMNNARITFDCNPEFYTRIAVAKMSCLPTNTTSLGPNYQPCQGCRELIDSMQFVDTLTLVSGTNSAYTLPATIIADINQKAGVNPTINWYPDRWLTNGNSLNAVMNPLEDMSYSLVVSSNNGNCERFQYTFFVDVSDHGRRATAPIYIMDDDDDTDNRSTPVIIGGSRPFVYDWTNDSRDSFAICSFGLLGGKRTLKLTLKDAHGCTYDFTPTVSCLRKGPDPRVAIFAFAGIILGLLLWLRFKRKGP